MKTSIRFHQTCHSLACSLVCLFCLFVGCLLACLTSQRYASAFQGRTCSDKLEVAGNSLSHQVTVY